MANASLITVIACGGPILMTLIVPPTSSLILSAVSNAYRSYGFIFESAPFLNSTPVTGSTSTLLDAGTCLIHTKMSITIPPHS